MSPHAVKRNRRLVKNYFLDSQAVMRETVPDIIRARAKALLDAHPDKPTQVEFGKAIGRGDSWVSLFLKGERSADVTVVVKMAKFFGVPVGYLLGEGKRGESALLVSVKGMCDELTDAGLQTLAAVAKTLPKKATDPTPPARGEAPDAARPSRLKNRHR
jgi:hypothetical protein